MVLAVMTLAINGGAVLPLAATFASTNLVSATILMAVVAMANVYTSDILLWQALSCKKRDFETLSDAIAGPLWKVRLEAVPSLLHLLLRSFLDHNCCADVRRLFDSGCVQCSSGRSSV